MTSFSIIGSSSGGGGGTSGLNDFVVRGTSLPDVDNANLQAAVAAANLAGKGTIWIDGPVYLTSDMIFTAPVSLRGIGPDAKIICRKGNGYLISWNQSLTCVESTAIKGVSSSTERSEFVTCPAGFTPNVGDWFMIWSYDPITDCEPHYISYNGFHFPLEIHQVAYWDSGTSRIYVEGMMQDKFVNAAFLQPVAMLNNVICDNLEFVGEVTQATSTTVLHFRGCNNLVVENVHLPRMGAGAISFQHCANVRAGGIVMEGVKAPDDVYGIVFGNVNGIDVHDSHLYNTRHAVTTTSGYAKHEITAATGFTADAGTDVFTRAAHGLVNGMAIKLSGASIPSNLSPSNNYFVVSATTDTFKISDTQGGSAIDLTSSGSGDVIFSSARWGTALNAIVRNCQGHEQYKWDDTPVDSRTLFDTHAEGYGITFQDCEVRCTGKNIGYAFQSRCRNAVFKDCRVRFGKGTAGYGFRTYGPNTIIDGCYLDGVATGICNQMTNSGGKFANGTIVRDCTFKDVWQPIWHAYGDNMRVSGCEFINSGNIAFGGPPIAAAYINIHHGTGHEIRGNNLSKGPNTYSIASWALPAANVKVYNNDLTGYSDGLGFQETLGNAFAGSAETDLITSSATEIIEGDVIQVYNATPGNLPGGLSLDVDYHVINYTYVSSTVRTFKLSLTPGGDPIDITADGAGSIITPYHDAKVAAYKPYNLNGTGFVTSVPGGGGAIESVVPTTPIVISNGVDTSYATLALACAALTNGDELLLPPTSLPVSTMITISASNVSVRSPYGRCRIHRAASDTSIEALLYITGDKNEIDGVEFDGLGSGTNANYGELIRIQGNNNVIRNCLGVNAYTSGTASNNSAFRIIGNDNEVVDCETRNSSYSGVRLSGLNNRVVGHRSIDDIQSVYYNDSQLDVLTVRNLYVKTTSVDGGRILITRVNGSSNAYTGGRAILDGIEMDLALFDPVSSSGAIVITAVSDADVRNSVIKHPTPTVNAAPSIRFTCDNIRLSNTITSGYIYHYGHVATGVTVDPATDVWTKSAHGFSNGQRVQLYNSTASNLPLVSGVTATNRQAFFIVNADATTFQLALTPGGAAVDVTTTGTGSHYVYQQGTSFTIDSCTLKTNHDYLYGIYFACSVWRMHIKNVRLERVTSTLFRCLDAVGDVDWVIEDSYLKTYSAGTTYLIGSSVWRTGIFGFWNNVAANDGGGALNVGGSTSFNFLKQCDGRSKTKFIGTGAAPSSTTITFAGGEEWTQSDAAAGAASSWTNVAAGTTPSWKVKTTLAS